MNSWLRVFLIIISITIMGVVFLFQNFSFSLVLEDLFSTNFGSNASFVINKTTRVLINDNSAILLIYGIFLKKKYVKLAFGVQFFELFILLPLYFLIKLSAEGPSEISSPILAQFHRLIINPTLMFLLIFGFLYQKNKRKM
ncbi:MAG: hypothetical protein ACNS60_10340 [Candidatus Cyclobacteriaceae bacterium M2_1C_046]